MDLMSNPLIARSFEPIAGVDMTLVMNEFDLFLRRFEPIRPLNSVLLSEGLVCLYTPYKFRAEPKHLSTIWTCPGHRHEGVEVGPRDPYNR